ncbi:MAG: Fic family protein [Hymenobacter sp.]|nr:MAG: Fic family protein [Hymenobacter sp.]
MYVEAPPSFSMSALSEEAWTKFLQQETTLMGWLQRIGKDYPYWTEVKRRAKPAGIAERDAWMLIKVMRQSNSRKLRLSDIASFTFSFQITEPTLEKLHRFDLYLGGILRSDSVIPAEDKNRYLVSSIMEEAIASSQLEGASTTREVAKEMLRKQRPPRTKSEQMILNNYRTIQFVLAQKQEPMTPELLCQIQAQMTQGTVRDENHTGHIRIGDSVEVWNEAAGEVVYVPPPATQLSELLQVFCTFANEELASNSNQAGVFIHPIVRACILHFLIGYIHPFIDGNGRTARAVFYWYLLRQGYWLVEYMSISRIIHESSTQYAKAYLHTENDANDLTYFINYQVKTLDQAFDSLQQYIGRKMAEKKQLYDFKRLGILNERQLVIVQELAKNPETPWTFREVENRFNVAYQTARTDLMGLEGLKLLEKRHVGKQKLLYFRTDEFDQQLNQLRSLPV